jgi:hypothetical protein
LIDALYRGRLCADSDQIRPRREMTRCARTELMHRNKQGRYWITASALPQRRVRTYCIAKPPLHPA